MMASGVPSLTGTGGVLTPSQRTGNLRGLMRKSLGPDKCAALLACRWLARRLGPLEPNIPVRVFGESAAGAARRLIVMPMNCPASAGSFFVCPVADVIAELLLLQAFLDRQTLSCCEGLGSPHPCRSSEFFAAL